MSPQAQLNPTEHGLVPEGEGWFVVNLAEARWFANGRFGAFCMFEGEPRFEQLGINVQVLQPGEPNCLYHSESLQEAFLVLSGECLVIVEGEERRLKAWDFFHSPPGTRHVFVGSGDGPCAILMTGARDPEGTLHYPIEPAAAKHGASSETDTENPRQAYEGTPKSEPCRAPAPFAS